MEDLTTERSFGSQTTCGIGVLGLFLTSYPWVFVQPGSGRRPVELNVGTVASHDSA